MMTTTTADSGTILRLIEACQHELHGYMSSERWETVERLAISSICVVCESHVDGREVMSADELDTLIGTYRSLPCYYEVSQPSRQEREEFRARYRR